MMALPMNSLYSLTWGDYGSSLVTAIQLLRCHNDLVDCTLAAGGRSFPAHKIVLCAASPFLLDLLKNTPCKHPVVMLAGVNANDLEALLEFVYRGEVSVDHAQLPSLLQAAQCLNIQGLAPQTVTKDDYTTHSIQLQHMIPQQHHDQDPLIATIATAPQQTVHAHVVEDIHQAGQILQTTTQNAAGQQQTIVTAETPKDVIQQFLPARKRKPRVKKMSPTAPKVAKVDGMETIISTPTTTHAAGTVVQQTQQQQQQQQQQQLQAQQQQQQQLQAQQQQQAIENGNETQIITSTPHIKTEVTKVETIVTMDPNMTPIAAPNTSGEVSTAGSATKSTKRSKNPSGTAKSRSRSQSEQPATCPICYAVIRQSRNLRRHLELRHFAKPGVKKEKKSKSGNETEAETTLSGTDEGAGNVSATIANTTNVPAGATVTLATTSGATTIPTIVGTAIVTNNQVATLKQDQSGTSSSGIIASAGGSGTPRMQEVIQFVSEDMFGQP